MKKILFSAIVIAISVMSCQKEAELVNVREIGCQFPDLTVTADAGVCTFDILADADAVISFDEKPSWASFVEDPDAESLSFRGDRKIAVSCSVNRGFERVATFSVKSGIYELSLSLTQYGILDNGLAFENGSVLVESEGGRFSVGVSTLLDYSEIETAIIYDGDSKEWIDPSSIEFSGTSMSFAIAGNDSEDRRFASIEAAGAKIRIVQKAGNEDDPVYVTPGGLRNLDPGLVTANIILVGRAVSDDAEGNGGEDRNFSAIMQDLNASARTVYLQSEEPENGRRYGVKIETDEIEDNIIRRYDLVHISLKGLVLSNDGDGADSPERYSISAVKAYDIVMTQRGSKDDAPVTDRTMAQLTDEDIYTFVRITDCSIPIRKGPFVPMHFTYRRSITKYPMVLLDRYGSTMYLLTNTTALWARDGKGLPQGSGAVSGVLVHEPCDNFEWNSAKASEMESVRLPEYVNGVGYIGRYQIRPVSRDGIDLAEDFETGNDFSMLVCEWRYFNADATRTTTLNVVDGVAYSTYPPVHDPVTDSRVNGRFFYSKQSQNPVSAMTDWCHLGPMANWKITDLPGSFGVSDGDGNDVHTDPYSSLKTSGIIGSSNASAIRANYWYSGDHNIPRLDEYYWQIEFSTSELSEANAPMSLQLGSVSGDGNNVGAPRYWLIKYSSDNGETWEVLTKNSYEGEPFVDLTGKMGSFKGVDYTYTVPDFPLLQERRLWQCPGYKYMSVTIPMSADVWGKEKLIFRLLPAMDVSGIDAAAKDSTYDSYDIYNNRRNNINYVAVRCNK